MQAKAAVLYEAGTPLRLEEVEVLPPNAVKSGPHVCRRRVS